jgi:hypothetical protein
MRMTWSSAGAVATCVYMRCFLLSLMYVPVGVPVGSRCCRSLSLSDGHLHAYMHAHKSFTNKLQRLLTTPLPHLMGLSVDSRKLASLRSLCAMWFVWQ